MKNSVYVSGQVYHVFNRGYNKQGLFHDTEDFLAYIYRWKVVLGIIPPPKDRNRNSRFKPVPKGSFDILFYCLMPNHFHFCIRQNQDKISISKVLQQVNTSYSRFFNRKYERVGHAYQGKPKNKIVHDDAYLLTLFAYIHNNPSNPSEWEFSSYKKYISFVENELVTGDDLLRGMIGDYKKIQAYIAKRKDETINL